MPKFDSSLLYNLNQILVFDKPFKYCNQNAWKKYFQNAWKKKRMQPICLEARAFI